MVMRHLARSLLNQAQSAQPVAQKRAAQVLQVVAGLDGLDAPGFEPLTPLERAALESAAAGLAEPAIAVRLGLTPAQTALALRGSFSKLARYLDPSIEDSEGEGGVGSGDREPRRPSPGSYPPRAAQEPLTD